LVISGGYDCLRMYSAAKDLALRYCSPFGG
jgi:hypothetical protein